MFTLKLNQLGDLYKLVTQWNTVIFMA